MNDSGDTQPLTLLKRIMAEKGYRFEVSADGNEERMIRPDGTVAVIARRTLQE